MWNKERLVYRLNGVAMNFLLGLARQTSMIYQFWAPRTFTGNTAIFGPPSPKAALDHRFLYSRLWIASFIASLFSFWIKRTAFKYNFVSHSFFNHSLSDPLLGQVVPAVNPRGDEKKTQFPALYVWQHQVRVIQPVEKLKPTYNNASKIHQECIMKIQG